MKVSGFSFIKNAIEYDYPIVESILSILPICDEFVIAVGESSDETLELIESIGSNKIKIIQTTWNENLREGGAVLAIETNKAFKNISKDSDWAFYIQADEVVHEKYIKQIYEGMQRFKNNYEVDGLLFKYAHFYGSYDYIGASLDWYKHEIRVIKNDPSIYSYKDAQGFRKGENKKLRVQPIDAYIYHYGWVKEPKAMQRKQKNFHKYWHKDEWVRKNVIDADQFDYLSQIKELNQFCSSHPEVMRKRISEKNWHFDCDISVDRRTIKDRFKEFLCRWFGLDFSYKNYTLNRSFFRKKE